ncbi:MAG: DUF4126 domain-containing protein [Sphingopyxis sp.]|nr:DUF4126 domain-containing protein [Sphingopyxis sp.]
MDPISAWATAAGLSWASGIRLYVVLFISGGLHALGWIELPVALRVLADPLVLMISGCLLCVEFLADKVPFVDSLWDSLHTFIRVPAGALLAAGVFGPDQAPTAIAAGLLGGTLATGSHVTKAGGRMLLNTSPEPVSNWTASFTEDALVPATLLLTFKYPLIVLGLVVLFTGLTVWLAPKLVRAIYSFVIRIGGRARAKRND